MPRGDDSHHPTVPSRLLKRSEAASYCGLSISSFGRICSVTAIELVKGNPRLNRFDIRDIDDWIEQKKSLGGDQADSKAQLLDRLLQ